LAELELTSRSEIGRTRAYRVGGLGQVKDTRAGVGLVKRELTTPDEIGRTSAYRVWSGLAKRELTTPDEIGRTSAYRVLAGLAKRELIAPERAGRQACRKKNAERAVLCAFSAAPASFGFGR
jgi:hypothetical protein